MPKVLSVFPELLTYSLFTPLILRVVLGFIFINSGARALKREKQSWVRVFEIINLKPAPFFEKIFSWVEIVAGLFLIVGFYTQAAALIVSIISLAELFLEHREPTILKNNIYYYLLLLTVSVSLMLTGAGFLAVDLPL